MLNAKEVWDIVNSIKYHHSFRSYLRYHSMDQLFESLLVNSSLGPKIITIVAENFSFLEDQARFLKATFAISDVKQLSFRQRMIKLLQIGPLPIEVEDQIIKTKWKIDRFDQFSVSICDQIKESLSDANSSGDRRLLFLNDASRLELSSSDHRELEKLLTLICRFKKDFGQYFVILYQNSELSNQSKFLRDLLYISDGVSRVRSCKAGYFTSIWYKKRVVIYSLLPEVVETSYHTFKIGKFHNSSNDLLCFQESKQVPKNYDLANDTCLDVPKELGMFNDSMRSSRLDDFENEKNSTEPYTAAQDPQKSQIFYYPDKEDDFDEDDPDNDLMI